jgi:intracellular sulfur oxidation DsrE/DsrF family protein
MRTKFSIAAAGILLFGAVSALAGPDDFVPGSTIPEYGKIAAVKVDQPVQSYSKFKIAFDTAKGAEPGELNRTLTSAARFINMHTAASVKPKNIKLAIVVHGGAVKDVTNDAFYTGGQEGIEEGEPIANANAALVKTLQDNGVEIYVCGQSAVYYGVDNEDLLPDVKMALSAMTSHALLQQKGYTLNPF